MKDETVAQAQQASTGGTAGCCCGGSARAVDGPDQKSGAVVRPRADTETLAKRGGGCCGKG